MRCFNEHNFRGRYELVLLEYFFNLGKDMKVNILGHEFRINHVRNYFGISICSKNTQVDNIK